MALYYIDTINGRAYKKTTREIEVKEKINK